MSIESSLNFRRVEETVTTSGSVAEEHLRRLGDDGYDVVIDLLPHDSPYAVPGEAGLVAEQGVTYVSIPVDFAAPTHDDLEAFVEAMDAAAGRTIHVHCAANYRVSAFYSLYAERRRRWTAAQADEHVSGIWDPTEHPVWAQFLTTERARLER